MGDLAGQSWDLLMDEAAYEASRPDDYEGEQRRGLGPVFPHRLPEDRRALGSQVLTTPFMDQAVLDLGRVAITELGLGTDDVPDVLTLGLSSTDAIGHSYGPYSREIHDQMLRVDRMLGEFFDFVDAAVSLDNVLVVLTSDHGVVPLPEYSRTQGIDAERLRMGEITRALNDHLAPDFGEPGEGVNGGWFRTYSYGWLQVNRELAAERGVDPEAVVEAARQYLESVDYLARVFSRSELLRDEPPGDVLETRVRNNFYADRSGDLYLVHPPYYLFDVGSAANHQSPYDYDTHVPLIFLGNGVAAERHMEPALMTDLAPTLAAIYDVQTPAGLEGTVLTPALGARR
jgi:hypothetical protein